MNQLSLPSAAKAYLAAVGAAAGYMIGVLDPTAIGLSAFGEVTTTQWMGLVTAVLGTFGVVWGVPNRELGS
jgi:hypothetical protein